MADKADILYVSLGGVDDYRTWVRLADLQCPQMNKYGRKIKITYGHILDGAASASGGARICGYMALILKHRRDL
jgi:hypothetical protein